MAAPWAKTNLGLWLVTLGVAAALLALGYEAAHWQLSSELDDCQRRQAQQEERANRLAAENNQLEGRLARSLAEAAAAKPGGQASQPLELEQTTGSRLLHRGQAQVLLDGQLILTLQEVGGSPRQALLLVKLGDGRQGQKALQAGQGVSFRVAGRQYRLIIKQIHTSSARYLLLPVK